jgi:hypothetical protein
MKFLATYVLVFFFFLSNLIGQQKETIQITGSFRNLTFQELVTKLEKQYPLHFYFEEKWVKSLQVNMEAENLSVPEFMDELLLPTMLDYVYQPPGAIFILPDKKFVHQLPEYYLPSIGPDSVQGKHRSLTGIEEKYLLGRQPDKIKTIVIGSWDKAKKGKMAVITGKLTDEETGESLVGARLYVPALQKGAATDGSGFVTMPLKPGIYAVVFQYLGMTEVKGSLDVRSDGYFSLSLKKQLHVMNEVLVHGQKTQKRGTRPGMENVSVKTMKELPALMGEKDVMKVAQMLPGIVSVGEGSAGVNVRGGNADQNLFYINEIPIYNSSHLFGFFSSINSAIIDNFTIYKGQVPAEYGGRLSSVFNVETRKGHKNNIFTQGGVSPISANVELEVPIVKEKASLILSARSTYSDWILKRLKDPDLRNSQASFYDFAGGLDFDLNDKNQISVLAYNSSDAFNLNGYTEYSYGNMGASVNYTHRFSPGLKSSVSVIGSNYSFETVEKSSASEAYSHAYELNHYEFRGSLSWLANEHHTFKIGTDAILYDLNRGTIKPYGTASLKKSVDLGMEKGLETSVYLDDNISLGPRLNFYTGLRFSMFTELGPKTVRDYLPGTPFDDNNVTNTKIYQNGDKISNYYHPELRVGMDFKVSENNSVKLSVTQMTQYVFMLSNSISIAPNDQWKLVDSHIKPPSSIQYSAGYYRENPKKGLNASFEFYYKQARHIVEYRDGTDFLASPYIETAILQGNQNAYGAEFMLSKTTGRVTGWLSYTHSRSFITVNGENDWGDINQGVKYPSNFDRPNVLNTFMNLEISRRFALATNLAYSSGRPVTLPQSVYYIDDQPFVDYSSRNEYRIPDYLRLDVSLRIEGNLKLKKPMHSYWTIGVYNLTGRSNANSIFFLSEEGKLHGYKYSVIGVPILTISWNWKLGNYENN